MGRLAKFTQRLLLIAALLIGGCLGLFAGYSAAATVVCGGGYCSGTESNDFIIGAKGYDEIVAGSGRDAAYGEGTGDALHGGADGDHAEGNTGNDTVHCEAGNENPSVIVPDPAGGVPGLCQGSDNGDDVFGGLGEDQVWGGLGTDSIYGLEHNDAMRADDGYADTVKGGSGYDTCDIGAGDTAFECESVY